MSIPVPTCTIRIRLFNMNALEWAQKKGRRAVVNYLKMVFAGESEKQGDDNRGNGL